MPPPRSRSRDLKSTLSNLLQRLRHQVANCGDEDGGGQL
jgi:hypothetical protein